MTGSYSVMVMPSGEQAFLAAMATLDAFKLSKILHADVPKGFEFLLQGRECITLSEHAEITNNKLHFSGTVDRFFEFDSEKAYAMSCANELHAVDTFGMMLGVKPKSHFPDLDHVTRTDLGLPFDWLYVSWREEEEQITKALESKGSGTILVRNAAGDDYRLLFDLVNRTTWVIGEASFATYLAASLGKKVIEFYPETWHRGWMSKFGKGDYHLIPDQNVSLMVKTIRSKMP